MSCAALLSHVPVAGCAVDHPWCCQECVPGRFPASSGNCALLLLRRADGRRQTGAGISDPMRGQDMFCSTATRGGHHKTPCGQGCAPTPPARARRIYHNIRYRHHPEPVQRDRDGSQVKTATNHPENRPDRAGFILTACMVMQPGESARISPKITRVSPVSGAFPLRPGPLRSGKAYRRRGGFSARTAAPRSASAPPPVPPSAAPPLPAPLQLPAAPHHVPFPRR